MNEQMSSAELLVHWLGLNVKAVFVLPFYIALQVLF